MNVLIDSGLLSNNPGLRLRTGSMNDLIYSTLKNKFGFTEFREGQVPVIESLLGGHSAAAVFPTGGGKSLCYQLPALLLPGITLVVSPLIALMKDQIDALTAKGIAAQRLDSSLSAEDYRRVVRQLRKGETKILYVAPERFNNELFRETVRPLPISLFAVDEAHCISEWGHNFRPDYLKLIDFANDFEAERILALTATATDQVLRDICRGFKIAAEHTVRTGFYRSNLRLLYTPLDRTDRDRILLGELKNQPPGPTIIYVTLQNTAEKLAEVLCAAGLRCQAYHAGLKDDERSRIQEWFMASGDGIIAATIAFGMGVDKADIRYIYHYNLPKSLENYAQEIGRAGRDNLPSVCQLLACADDLTILENFVYGDTPDQQAVRELLEGLFSLGNEFDIDLYNLSYTCDIRILVLRTLLTHLDLEGYLRSGTPFYRNYKFKPRMSSSDILGHFSGERRIFLASLFRQATKARTWFHIDLSSAAKALNTGRERIVMALDWLETKNMLEVDVSGIRHRYHRLKKPEDLESLAFQLSERMLKRESADIHRLQQVVDLVNSSTCQTTGLGRYFGENRGQNCGHCSCCRNGPVRMAERPFQSIPANLDEKVLALFEDEGKSTGILFRARPLARFLCGIQSPRISRAKLRDHSLFGTLDGTPFKLVLKWSEAFLKPKFQLKK
ncbi:MAG: RecQ family ATP-dependent DNA helicase [Methylococcales bacterium]